MHDQHMLKFRGSINNSLHSSDCCPQHLYSGDHCNALVNFLNAKIFNSNSVHWLLHLQQFFSSHSSNYILAAALKFPPVNSGLLPHLSSKPITSQICCSNTDSGPNNFNNLCSICHYRLKFWKKQLIPKFTLSSSTTTFMNSSDPITAQKEPYSE